MKARPVNHLLCASTLIRARYSPERASAALQCTTCARQLQRGEDRRRWRKQRSRGIVRLRAMAGDAALARS